MAGRLRMEPEHLLDPRADVPETPPALPQLELIDETIRQVVAEGAQLRLALPQMGFTLRVFVFDALGIHADEGQRHQLHGQDLRQRVEAAKALQGLERRAGVRIDERKRPAKSSPQSLVIP